MADAVAMVRVVIRGQNLPALRQFYADVFGWNTFEIVPGYTEVDTVPHEHDERGNDLFPPLELTTQSGGIYWRYQSESSPPRMHQRGPYIGIASGEPAAIPYVEVADLASILAKVEAAGGRVTQPSTEIPGFTFVARFADLEGTEIGLQQRLAS